MTAPLHFFTDSNGPAPVSYYHSNFDGLKRTIRFSGYPHGLLGDLLDALCQQARQEGLALEIVHHCLDNSVQGVILPERSTGVFGFDPEDPAQPCILGLLENPDLNAAQESVLAARQAFLRARAFHNSQEQIYLSHMDFAAADKLAEETIHALLGGKSGTRRGREIHRFFGAATAEGNLDYIPEVTEEIPRRFFIKGRPGTGKSTFLKKVADAALRRGCTTEIYHCALDPKSLDLVAVRELGFCLLDSTAPHEYFPSREGDEILDMYEMCVEPGTDEAHKAELQMLEASYKELVRSATASLLEAKQARDRWEASLPPLEGKSVERAKSRLLEEVFGSGKEPAEAS